MDVVLDRVSRALEEAVDAMESTYRNERLLSLQSNDKLPEMDSWRKARDVIDRADRLIQLLQPPAVQLAERYLAYMDTKCLVAVTSYGVAETLDNGPLAVSEIACVCELKSDNLDRILQHLASSGIFAFDLTHRTYSHTPASQLLSRAHWTQWHRWVELYGNEFFDIARSISKSIRLGEFRKALHIEYGEVKDIFSLFEERGMTAQFHQALGAAANAQSPGMVNDYGWGELEETVILDISGGGGEFLAMLLRHYPRLRGALLELPSVVAIAKPKFDLPNGQLSDVNKRMVAFHSGDFLREVPPYEVYTMKWCLHNWDDHQVVVILSNIRKAIIQSSRSRLVIIDSVIASGRSSQVSRLGGLIMMATTDGRERTEDEWLELAGRGGWRVEAIWSLRNVWAAAIDLRPV